MVKNWFVAFFLFPLKNMRRIVKQKILLPIKDYGFNKKMFRLLLYLEINDY